MKLMKLNVEGTKYKTPLPSTIGTNNIIKRDYEFWEFVSMWNCGG